MERRLFRVGCGKYQFMVVAEDEKQAVDIVGTRENLAFMPLKVLEEISKVDGYNVLLVTDEELAEAEQPEEIEGTLAPEQLETMTKAELIKLATDMELEVNDKMTKAELIEKITAEKIIVDKENIINPEE